MKTASRIVGSAAFHAGFEAQDSPTYGAERRGAPMAAYTRVSKEPILERERASFEFFDEVLAETDRDSLNLATVKDIQFTQSHEGRVVLEQPGSVGLAAHGSGLFPAHDQVGIGSFSGFNNPVHQIFHVSR